MNENTPKETITLDVRPVLAAGEEPLQMILEAADSLGRDGILEVTAPFEPLPLYGVLSGRGFAHAMAEPEPGTYLVRFTQTGITGDTTVAEAYERYPATAEPLADYGLDLCCGGVHPISFAADAHGVDPERLLADLQQAALRDLRQAVNGVTRPNRA